MAWHRALRALPPEAAHRLALGLARLAPPPVGGRPPPDPRLAVELAGLRLPHPIGLAAGFDKDARAVGGLLRLGFAAVEVGTVTPRAQAGNPRPRLFRLPEDGALVNRLGFNNGGHAAAAARLAGRDRGLGAVGVNLGVNRDAPDPLADYLAGIEAFSGLADYLTINVSSPNTPGLRDLQRAERLAALLGPLVARRDALAAAAGAAGGRPPLLLKIAPDLTDAEADAVVDVALASGIDGLIVGNTTVARPPALRSPRAREAGGLSGRPLMAPSTALLRRLRRRLGPALPLVGVGGVASPEDAFAKIRAGATAVQLYTGLVYEGPGLVRRLVRGLGRQLDAHGHATLAGAIGADA